ncbi:hypothetical protein [Sphingomonas jeddahensis]|uniref:Uncharacterized protein n=1 Tax=Sphingomonas jeddahensis TaxID=1915074 RepID=A0A1V2EWS1_9SPHN|nr:hypothetical protein [Sphingomonas jeddahensis]ONF96983.1 hypothetical protein SPHI_04150 [Sphingomonas jeddahensis]
MQQWIPALPAPEPQPAPSADPLAFTPVPRKYRYDGWTAERQRAFIAALAETGSVTAAARRINMRTVGAYYLRRQPGADSFRAAWEAALASGVQRLTDIAFERAIEGVPVPVFHKGEQVGERRWYNDRLLMFVLKHHQPERYGKPAALPPGTKHPDTLAREAAQDGCPACRERAKEDAEKARVAAEQAKLDNNKWLENMVSTYYYKVLAERCARREGDIVASDLYLRQLCYFELIQNCGMRQDLIPLYWPDEDGALPIHAMEVEPGPLSEMLDRLRRQAWKAAGERPGPARDVHPTCAWRGEVFRGDTAREREQARKQAQRMIAEGQALWEACGTEESWSRFKAASGS